MDYHRRKGPANISKQNLQLYSSKINKMDFKVLKTMGHNTQLRKEIPFRKKGNSDFTFLEVRADTSK